MSDMPEVPYAARGFKGTKTIPGGRIPGYLALAAYNCRYANYIYGYAGITASAIWLE